MARTAGLLLLLNFAIGVFTNLFILGPLTFSADYLTKIPENPGKIIIAVLLYLTGAGLYVGIAVVLMPVFKKISPALALMFFGFSLVSFAVISLDNLGILALLSVSKAYTKAVSRDSDHLKTLGTVLYAVRMWAHLLVILIGCVSLFIFYYLFLRSKQLPRVISAAGLLGVLLMFAAVLTDLFGYGLFMLLFLPAGIVQVVTGIWLMARGFNRSNAITGIPENLV